MAVTAASRQSTRRGVSGPHDSFGGPYDTIYACKKLLFASLFLGLMPLLCPPPLESQTTPEDTVAGLRVADGLEITLWAAEPDVINPTNLDIDERGRIWITEAVNYRRHLFEQPDYRDEGDRITILEDTDGDGRVDKVKVFDQDPRLRSPLGIAVLGDRVIVSQSPDVIVYTKDEEDNIVSREVFLTGWGGVDHDHGVHAIVYGPDGNYYFNNGDRGLDVTDRGGCRVVSGPDEKYYGGSVLRVRPDGTGLEIVGHNFRNPYEVTVDSFGNIWQSDNDDDGNEWVRINYVMEGGNHGYWGPGGKRWREDRGTHFPPGRPWRGSDAAEDRCGIAFWNHGLRRQPAAEALLAQAAACRQRTARAARLPCRARRSRVPGVDGNGCRWRRYLVPSR